MCPYLGPLFDLRLLFILLGFLYSFRVSFLQLLYAAFFCLSFIISSFVRYISTTSLFHFWEFFCSESIINLLLLPPCIAKIAELGFWPVYCFDQCTESDYIRTCFLVFAFIYTIKMKIIFWCGCFQCVDQCM